jgi:hypothetical protein
MPGLALLEGEKLLMELRPHVLALWDMYFTWVWVIVLSLLFIGYADEISRLPENPLLFVTQYLESAAQPRNLGVLKSVPGASDAISTVSKVATDGSKTVRSYSNVVLWLAALLVSAFIVSVFKIEFKWIALMMGVGLLGVGLSTYLELPMEAAYYIAIISSILCICCVEVYRQAHTFYITNMRIVTEVRFTSLKRNELSFDKINNLVLEQGALGRIFDFGTVIPVTASGLGMGSDFSSVTVGTAGSVMGAPVAAGVSGGRTVQTPRVKSMFGIYGVPDPETVEETISRQMHDFVNAPYLRKMTEQLDDIKKNIGDKNER